MGGIKIDERKEIELTSQRAIVYLPKNCYKVTLEAQCMIDDKTQTVHQTLNLSEIAEAKRKAKDGYFGDLPATCSGMPMALLYLPECAVYIRIDCESRNESGIITSTMTMEPDELSSAFYEGDMNYIDDDDVFTLTDYGRQCLEEQHDR